MDTNFRVSVSNRLAGNNFKLKEVKSFFYKTVSRAELLIFLSVRVKGGMSLRNGMWHGLRNDIIMLIIM